MLSLALVQIVEAINNAENDAIILCGETGSGKSTQVQHY
jgi:HrpA-like RNA helicase